MVTGQELRLGEKQKKRTAKKELGRMLQHYLNAFLPKFYHQYWGDANPPPIFIPILTLIQVIKDTSDEQTLLLTNDKMISHIVSNFVS